MANLGPIPVPAALEPALPYLKFAVAVAGVVATVLSVTLATPPGWVFLVIAVATALGVYTVPNKNVKAILQDGLTALSDAGEAVAAAKAQDYAGAEADASAAVTSGEAAVTGAEAVVRDLTQTSPFKSYKPFGRP